MTWEQAIRVCKLGRADRTLIDPDNFEEPNVVVGLANKIQEIGSIELQRVAAAFHTAGATEWVKLPLARAYKYDDWRPHDPIDVVSILAMTSKPEKKRE